MRRADVEDHPALDPDEGDQVRHRGHEAAEAEGRALDARQPHVLAVGDLGQLGGLVARPEGHPVLGLGGEALGRRKRDVLGRALGLGAQPLDQRLGRAADPLGDIRFGHGHGRVVCSP